jgi:hypothetical protein
MCLCHVFAVTHASEAPTDEQLIEDFKKEYQEKYKGILDSNQTPQKKCLAILQKEFDTLNQLMDRNKQKSNTVAKEDLDKIRKKIVLLLKGKVFPLARVSSPEDKQNLKNILVMNGFQLQNFSSDFNEGNAQEKELKNLLKKGRYLHTFTSRFKKDKELEFQPIQWPQNGRDEEKKKKVREAVIAYFQTQDSGMSGGDLEQWFDENFTIEKQDSEKAGSFSGDIFLIKSKKEIKVSEAEHKTIREWGLKDFEKPIPPGRTVFIFKQIKDFKKDTEKQQEWSGIIPEEGPALLKQRQEKFSRLIPFNLKMRWIFPEAIFYDKDLLPDNVYQYCYFSLLHAARGQELTRSFDFLEDFGKAFAEFHMKITGKNNANELLDAQSICHGDFHHRNIFFEKTNHKGFQFYLIDNASAKKMKVKNIIKIDLFLFFANHFGLEIALENLKKGCNLFLDGCEKMCPGIKKGILESFKEVVDQINDNEEMKTIDVEDIKDHRQIGAFERDNNLGTFCNYVTEELVIEGKS